MEDVLFNVFDFDHYSPEIVELLGQVLLKHGFPNSNMFTNEYIAAKQAREYLQITKERESGYVLLSDLTF